MAKEKRNDIEIVTDSDFVYVQKDEHIHDKKFQTKPTTFFKDAMKRFVKNKSSVVAAGILAALILMAIIVPVADRNDITTNSMDMQYLPPKWFSGDMGGFMDGTGYVEHVVLDPHEKDAEGNYRLPSDSSYKENAIIGKIEATETFADELSDGVKKYGKNGDIAIANVGTTDRVTFDWSCSSPAGLVSPSVSFGKEEAVSYSANIDLEPTKNSIVADLGEEGEFYAYLVFSFSHSGTDYLVSLTDPINLAVAETGRIACDDVVATIEAEEEIANLGLTTYSGKLGILLGIPEDQGHSVQTLYLKSTEASASVSDISKASFNNATRALTLIENLSADAYSRYQTAKLGIYHSQVTYGAFRYDYYKAVFGSVDYDDPKPVYQSKKYSGYDVDQFIARGWMTYEWGTGENLGTFALTEEGKIYCPIREITAQRVVKPSMLVPEGFSEVTANISYYRQLAYEGRIPDYTPPMYFFGTDRNGLDFFKVVFSGLLVSLGLGLLSSAINIVIGLIWGAIAGYFGGWVDLIMERLVEILGGMPWIVMMTLIVLLTGSNSFWIFLLALCITGWIGISGVTRSQFYRYKGREYVLASRTLGASDARLIFKHILPNAIGTIVTSAVLMIPSVIFTEANIAYLLPGTMQLSGSFGVTLSNAQADLRQYPFLIVSASIVMILIMISFNLFGNGLRDAFNPSLKGSDE